MDLDLIQRTLRQFAAERDWERFHTPKNLAVALMVEAAELAEIFQWMTPEQSMSAHSDKVEQERIGDEVADVLLYLLQLSDRCGIDLKRAVDRKLIKNARKHPPIGHAHDLGLDTSQVGFMSPVKRSAKSPVAAKTSVKKSAPAKQAARVKAVSPVPAKNVAKGKSPMAAIEAPTQRPAATSKPVTMTSAVQTPVNDLAYARVIKGLATNKNKPTRTARLHGAVKSLLDGGNADGETVDAVVARLVADRHVVIDKEGAVTFA